ncbi:helix-turn-helix domain-containing protein [Micromonospora sp. NPDC001898]|uniref:helix-turn-helix domain-containing protein n=1 Tax=Micromonospora sp. NPDC001898 TaxID=3364221 RepID=UPI003689A492
MTTHDLPIGRRVAQLRARRRMTQQMLADRLGKSKSWVDKVERGARALDRFTVIRELAAALRVDPVALLGRDARPPSVGAAVDGVDGVRAALARYDTVLTGPGGRAAPPAGELARRVGHAWLTYQHADYPQLLRMLPALLGDAQRAHSGGGGDGGAELLVQAYRITSSVLVKLGEGDLGWLAADRAMSVSTGDPLLVAAATVPLGQALRDLGRARPALAVTIAAAHRIAPTVPRDGPPQHLALCGTLLVQAALAAAACGDAPGVRELVDQAAGIAERLGDDGPDLHWTGFGPTAVELARVATAVDLGSGGEAVTRHEKVIGGDAWRRLPAEHRAAYLIDASRAYLQVGDPFAAGRVLVEADRTAPAEVRLRPVARTVIVALMRGGPVPADVARLATAVGLG